MWDRAWFSEAKISKHLVLRVNVDPNSAFALGLSCSLSLRKGLDLGVGLWIPFWEISLDLTDNRVWYPWGWNSRSIVRNWYPTGWRSIQEASRIRREQIASGSPPENYGLTDVGVGRLDCKFKPE